MSGYDDDRNDAVNLEGGEPPRSRWLAAMKERLQDSWRSGVVFFNDLRRLFARFIDPDAPASKALYTYFVSVPTPNEKYGPGANGVAAVMCNTPYQVIDFQIMCRAATFNLTSFFIGDTNMLLGAGSVPADCFFPMVQNRFVRFTEVERGQTVQIGFVNVASEGEPEPITIVLKVRSYRRS
jgi:hypothetical protein